ncbi:MAG: oligosaccharide flippase family protein [Verrucomicrobia bacterium]|nr:oligosaccharide flippase family protein [Verrucomicrobiota bacterium]
MSAKSPIKENRLAERTVGNALWNIVPFAWSFVIGLVILPMVINRLGLEHFGIFGIFGVILAPLGLANLGFGEATIKYVAQHAQAGDLETAAKYLRTTLWMNLLVGLLGGLLLWLAGPSLVFRFFKITASEHELVSQCFLVVAFGWFFSQIAAVFMGIPAAFQQFKKVAIVQVLSATVTAALSISFVMGGGGLLGYTLANAIASVFASAAWYICGRQVFGKLTLRPKLFREVWRSSFHYGGWQTLAQIGGLLASQSERFLLGVFLTPTALGLYNAAFSLESRAYLVVFRMSEVLFPMFSATSSETLEQKANKLMRASWLLTTLSVMILIPLVPLAEPLLSLWINPDTGRQAALVLRFLALTGAIGCATNASYFFLLGNGKTTWIALLTITTGLTTFGVSACLLPRYGLKAAAVSGVAAMLAQQVVLGFFMLRSIFQKHLSVWDLVVTLHFPVWIGLIVSLGFWLLGVDKIVTNWAWLIASYISIASICGGAVLAVDVLLPNGRQHLEDLRRIVCWGKDLVAAKVNKVPCVA